ncbi:MAG: IS3 family transposase [Syntrophomonadaceae bacterium]|nr:IS3 family transposase [Syntrophomonadaceae bacterium]
MWAYLRACYIVGENGTRHREIRHVHWSYFKTINEARQVLFEYIEVFYNRQRVQKRLGYLSLIQWVKQWQRQASQLVAQQIVRKSVDFPSWPGREEK